MLAVAFRSKLEDMMKERGLKETELPGIAEKLLNAANTSDEKMSEGDGPPSYLMNELEGLFVQHQYAQKRVNEAGSSLYI